MNKLIPIIAIALVVGGGSFYGGIKYAESKGSGMRLTQEDFQKRSQELGANVTGGFRGNLRGNGGGGFANGEIISKDDKSVTIKLLDGGSKIVFLSESTKITKSVEGVLSDLKIGENVMVNGSVNSDGSMTAQTIQLPR